MTDRKNNTYTPVLYLPRIALNMQTGVQPPNHQQIYLDC